VPTKKWILACCCIQIFAAVVSAHSQAAPAATGKTISLAAGGMVSGFQPDFYALYGVPGESPNRLYGGGAYVDAHFSRWLQIEAEGRWLHFNELYGINENTYLIGPRIAPYTFLKFTPYGKALIGLGNGSLLTGTTLTIAYGGGVDYRLTRRLTLRCFDFEYQQWRVSPTALYPYGGSVGLSYKIF
jgi:hypothetical protein